METLIDRYYADTSVVIEGTPENRLLSNLPCFRCGVCCHRYQPRIDLTEARVIADSLGTTWQEFVANYLDSRYFGEERFLLRQKNGACIFLERIDEKVTTCTIHLFKPSACRDWTPGLFRKECQTGLAQMWKLTVDQKGNLQGDKDDVARFYSFIGSLC